MLQLDNSTQKIKNKVLGSLKLPGKRKMKSKTSRFKQYFLLPVAVLFSAVFICMPIVRADQYDEQIKQLEVVNGQNHSSVQQLQIQANSYQGEIERLQSQINVLQAEIQANVAKRDSLQAQIKAAEEELAKQKVMLGESVKAVYVEGDISTLEMLASSEDLSTFLDTLTYRENIQDKIRGTLDKINALKAQLKTQKSEVEKLLADQHAMKGQLASSQAQQNAMLDYTEGQKSEFNAKIKNNNASIAELRRQQLIANARFIGGPAGSGPACGGGYPARWCEIPQDSVIDSWGMYNRECVSYAAFKVAASGRHMPYWGGVGNANQWDDNARAAGIPVDGNPRAGDVAQTDAGGYGHVMYVEHVYGDGTIYISQYNAGLDGRYSEKRISAAGLEFIHF